MPSPAVYVLAVVGTVAAGLAFKEFVYDPHIHPWIIAVRERHREKRLRNRMYRTPMMETFITSGPPGDSDASNGNKVEEMKEMKASNGLRSRNYKSFPQEEDSQPLIRLSSSTTSDAELLLDSSSSFPSSSFTSTSRLPKDANQNIGVDHSPTPPAVASPPPPRIVQQSVDLSSAPTTVINSTLSSPRIPSLSQTHPLQLDVEADVELLSRPSTSSSSSSFVSSVNVRSASSLSTRSLEEYDEVMSQTSRLSSSSGLRNRNSPLANSGISSPFSSSPDPFSHSSAMNLAASTTSSFGEGASVYHSFASPDLNSFIRPLSRTSTNNDERSDMDFLSDLDVASEMSWEDAGSVGGTDGGRG